MKDAKYKLYEDFQKEFPIENLGELPLERYTNLNRTDSFCYWVESKTYELGSIWGGTSYKFGIYEYNKKPNNPTVLTEDEKYAWYKKYDAKTREEAFDIVRASIVRIANAALAGNIEEVNKDDYAISGVFKWKVAFLYSNLSLIPIYKKDMLVDVAGKLGLANPESKSIPALQAFLMEQKGERDLFEFYEYLLALNNEAGKATYTSLSTSVKSSVKTKYWWLNASPKVWKMSEWKVGEVQEYTLYNGSGNKRRIFQNFLDAVENDIVICYETNPVKKITTIAKVSKANDGKRISFCKLKTLSEPIEYSIIKEHPDLQQMEFLVNPNGSFFSLSEKEFNVIMGIIRQNNDEEVEPISSPVYTRENFLSEVYMNPDSYDELVELLKIKKNIILQGAPGVGKTFCAERLAYSIMGKKDERRIKTIQFHQSYSYEDFIMGYKPSGDSFRLRNGVFYNFCIEASNNPNEDYFFIIDEINRGNLSKIFGELLMMIEKDYRGKEITLAYSDQGFHVPDNLYIIGMMNTADRSLALIDYALRRRFSFFDMKPGFGSDGFKAHLEAVGNEKFEKLIKLISELNSEISNDDSLGSGFEIGHSYFCGKPEDITDSYIVKIVKYDIFPTIREYWFDNDKKAADWIEKLTKVLND